MPAKFVIQGGRPLEGRTSIFGSKNSALSIIAAAGLAARGESILENVPDLTDVHDLCEILRHLGSEVEFVDAGTLRVRAAELNGYKAPYEVARRLRGSTYVVGLLLARLGRAEVACPGGCPIGSRPVDFHVKALQAMGAEVVVERGCVVAQTDRLRPGRLYIDRASFGTTLNVMIAAALTPGTTVLENAALEPEVVDLANFINAMGGKVRGAGTSVIRVEGAANLQGAAHEIIPDRLEAGTFLTAAAITGGAVQVENCIPEHVRALSVKLMEAGMQVEEGDDFIRLQGGGPIRSVDIETQPHPGFPTDMQSPFLALMALGDGISVVHETVFENRFAYTGELVRMGANIKVDRNAAIVRGVERLTACPVEAGDIRGGVALVLAALAAEGVSQLTGVQFIDRGHSRLEERLAGMGADIRRVELEPAVI